MTNIDNTQMKVISNVARDILQSASVFKTLPTVVWEYVANSLQYVDQNVTPTVAVKINAAKKSVSINDNGAGMDEAGLRNFFTMHGINQERLSGKAGRGMFGTGKSAAFGIAGCLTVRTVRNGHRNTIILSRSEIERVAQQGTATEVPLRRLESNIQTTEANGTIITIEDISVKCDSLAVIAYLMRHVGRGFKDAEIIVNGQEIEYEESSFVEELTFTETGKNAALLGNVQLKVKVSPSPLDEERRGIDITSNGVLFETTLGSVAGKEMSQYIFGDLEVPGLINQGSGQNPAYNMTRDMKLNIENSFVQAIHTFISVHVDEVRRRLVESERKRRQTEEAQRLQRQADDIAKLLNADFAEYTDKVERIRATVSSVSRDRGPENTTEPGESLIQTIFGGDEAIAIIADEGGPGGSSEGEGGGGGGQHHTNPLVESKESGDPLGRSVDVRPSKRPSRGGFHVEYRNTGPDDLRAKYDRDTRTIVINLDFPQIEEAIKSEGPSSAPFKRLSNEIAITEYAIAVTSELVRSSVYQDPSDILYEIRQTINRINRRAATAVTITG